MVRPTVTLKRDPHGWLCGGLTTGIPASTPVAEVKVELAAKIRDNPRLQHELGLLGADAFAFRVVGGKRRTSRPRKWIQKALNPARKGALHRQLGVPLGEKIPLAMLEAASHAPGKLGRRARLAKTLRRIGQKRKQKKGTR